MHETFKAKQDWLKRVKRSKAFNHATKTFAWCVMDHMYGDKTVSNPGGALIKSETNIAPNKQGAHRKALSDAGALSCVLVKNSKGDWDSYEYTLNLDWEESASDKGSTPEGNTLRPTGEQGLPHRATPVPPTGETNLSSQPIKEPQNESIKVTTVPSGPVDNSLPNYAVKEDFEYEDASWDAGNRDAAHAVLAPVKVTGGWRVGCVTYLREFDAIAASERAKEKEQVS